jgi:hypothetical protein
MRFLAFKAKLSQMGACLLLLLSMETIEDTPKTSSKGVIPVATLIVDPLQTLRLGVIQATGSVAQMYGELDLSSYQSIVPGSRQLVEEMVP